MPMFAMPTQPKAEVYAPQELHDQVADYANRHDITSKSEAWRELARRGLQAEIVERDV